MILSVDPDDKTLLERFREAAEEYSVPHAFRTRCANEACNGFQGAARYLDAERLGQGTAIICPDCSEVTCRLRKTLIASNSIHVCKLDEKDKEMLAFKKALPEDERWLWQKCPTCGIWVEKESACNHMTCNCGGHFCLICGRLWSERTTNCTWGCPHFEQPATTRLRMVRCVDRFQKAQARTSWTVTISSTTKVAVGHASSANGPRTSSITGADGAMLPSAGGAVTVTSIYVERYVGSIRGQEAIRTASI